MSAIRLEPAEFYQLVAQVRLQEVLRLELRQKQQEFAVSGAQGTALLESLSKKYGFDAKAEYGFDEDTLSLRPREVQ